MRMGSIFDNIISLNRYLSLSYCWYATVYTEIMCLVHCSFLVGRENRIEK